MTTYNPGNAPEVPVSADVAAFAARVAALDADDYVRIRKIGESRTARHAMYKAARPVGRVTTDEVRAPAVHAIFAAADTAARRIAEERDSDLDRWTGCDWFNQPERGIYAGICSVAVSAVWGLVARDHIGDVFTHRHYQAMTARARRVGLTIHPDDN